LYQKLKKGCVELSEKVSEEFKVVYEGTEAKMLKYDDAK